jgi:hypothetical protein
MEMRKGVGPEKSGNVGGGKDLKTNDACLAQLCHSQMSYTDQFRTFEYRCRQGVKRRLRERLAAVGCRSLPVYHRFRLLRGHFP